MFKEIEEEKEKNLERDFDVKIFIKAFRIILFISIILILATLIPSLFVKGNTEDINYIFEDNILYNNDNITLSDSFNTRNRTIPTGLYEATYSFTDDDNGSIPDNFIVFETGGSVRVLSNYSGHDKVVKMIDNNILESIYLYNYNLSEVSGTCEFWCRFDQTDLNSYFYVMDGIPNIGVTINFKDDGDIAYYDSSWHVVATYSANIWYHIRIDFESSTGSYLGLAKNYWNFYINGELIGTYEDAGTPTLYDTVLFRTHTTTTGNIYIDSLGYSWESTYDFDDDIVGEEPLGWVSNNGVGCTTLIKDSLDGFNNVLELSDTSSNAIAKISKFFEGELNQIIDLYVAKSYLGLYSSFYFKLKSAQHDIISIIFTENDIIWQGGVVKYDALVVNIFIHIKLVLDSTQGRWDCYIDDILELEDATYIYNTGNPIDNFYFSTAISADTYSCYIDNIGLSAEPGYETYNNVIPQFNSTNDIEVAKDEFAFDSNGIQEEIRTLNDEELINGWEAGVPLSNLYVIESSKSYDREIKLYSYSVHSPSLEKVFDLTTDGIFNLTMVMTYLNMENDGSSLYFGIWASDITYFSLIRLYYTGGIIYLQSMNKDGGGSYTNLLELNLNNYLIREFNFLVSENGIVKFRYKDSSGINNVYCFSKIDGATNIYHKVHLSSAMNDADGTQEFHIDSLDISINGTTLNYVNDYSFYNYNLSLSNWNSKEHNLFTINGNGYFSFGVYNQENFESIRGFYNYSGVNKIFNTYNSTFSLNSPFITFITNGSILISEIKITGVKLNQGGYGYFLDFNYGNINIDESYFYVNGDKLYYTLTTDDNELEYIQAVLDVNDQDTANYTLNWGGIKNFASLYSEFRLNYYDGNFNPYVLKTSYQAQNIIIPQDKIIIDFTLLITDNDENINGTISGYINSFSLYYSSTIFFDVILTDYLNIIAPVALISVITITIWQLTKKKSGTMLIIPSIAFMSLMSFICGFIELWLLFTLLLCSGIMLYGKWEDIFITFSSITTMILAFLVSASVIDFWVFYGSLIILLGYTIFAMKKGITYGR